MTRNIMNILGLLIIVVLVPNKVIYAQSSESITVNIGQLSIMPNTVVSTYFDFKNGNLGSVFNNGEIQFYKSYHNDGLFTYTTGNTTGIALFKGNQLQNLTGSKPSEYFDIVFDNSSSEYPFELKNDFLINGKANFIQGIVKVNVDAEASILFKENATHTQVSNQSYVDGVVDKKGNKAFTFPIGKNGYYRYASISASESLIDLYSSEYFLNNSNLLYPHQKRVGNIEVINTKEFWVINQAKKGSGSVIITLSWNNNTTPMELLTNPEKELHIVRWDVQEQLWVDEGGVVDIERKEIATPTSITNYGIFTLAKVKPAPSYEEKDIVVYNLVTPNADGKNDYFIIENINRFPNNTVEIYNRWGVKVFDTKSYDSAGNVFRGYSDGRITINKNEKLPSGTYFYVIEYDFKGTRIKKTGYLHLENE
ncbi:MULTISPECIES: gliding motility-associated C-terminal domain-containing protein [Myroides]|uniref:gliding motility-associated C-terminal domain-containing protein n=1 Tax=Myroides TaxID=76831 RepID=UPI003101AA3F